MLIRRTLSILLGVLLVVPCAARAEVALPFALDTYQQDVHRPYRTQDGLGEDSIQRIALDATGAVVATTTAGADRFDGDTWVAVDSGAETPGPIELNPRQMARLRSVAGDKVTLRKVAVLQDEFAVAADTGLYIGDGRDWVLALPRAGAVRWAPVDVRAVVYDASGRLWFAAPQGVGYREREGGWKLFTGAEGLPFNDFTCMAAGPDSVWFGTTNGAIRYRDGQWSFRQGRRWLLDNHVRDIAVDAEGNAWIATAKGVSCIATQAMTLEAKADFFEDEIENFHRRSSLGYVTPAKLSTPGDKSTAVATFTDNEGITTGYYLGAMGLKYAVTGDAETKAKAMRAFRALAFLSEVTQGGTHPAPEGFVARTVRPTSLPDPNPDFDLDYDIGRNQRDTLWKIIQPRWPVDETGDWYWKNDSSTDELDGHFFGYAIYFDRVCETAAERDEVRTVVRRIMDHVIDHGYNMVDYDGTPTRWGHMSPDDLNRNEAWVVERGLNSYSILTFLSVAHHITGDQKYRDEYLKLALDHGYGMNGMTQPRDYVGPGTSGQPDDSMAFMNYYHLIRYETDPKLLSMYYHAIHRHWQQEKYERNTFINFIYAACCAGKIRTDQWGAEDLTPPPHCYADGVDTLKRYPLDLITWPQSNRHRTDMTLLQDHLDQPEGKAGHGIDCSPFPIDERHATRWDRDAWILSYDGEGTTLRTGTFYLTAYYMGRAHGFIAE